MTSRQSFVWGCVGGFAPEILRWYKLFSSGASIPNLNWPLYAISLALYVMLAGAVAVAFRPDNEWKGLWVGASLPAIIAVLVQAAPKQ